MKQILEDLANENVSLMSRRQQRYYHDLHIDPHGTGNVLHDQFSYETNRPSTPASMERMTQSSPFLYRYELPSGNNLNVHGSDLDHLHFGHVKSRNNEHLGKYKERIIGVDIAILCGAADSLGLKKVYRNDIDSLCQKAMIQTAIDTVRDLPVYLKKY